MYEIKQNIIYNNEAKGIFLELVQNDRNNKRFKMLPERVPHGCIHMPCLFVFCFSNDDPGLTMAIFITGSNLFPDASVWETAYITLSALCSYSAYSQHIQ